MDSGTETVLRDSFKAILGDHYRDDLSLCRLAGLIENRLFKLHRILSNRGNAMKPKKPRIKNVALYRLSLTAKIGKDACIGIRIPEGVKKDDWIKYQMFCCFEELAMYLDGKEQEN